MNRAKCLFVSVLFMVIVPAPASLSQEAPSASARIHKPLIYQIGNVVHINADGPRPLLRALDALHEKYGWIVDYEDPQLPAPPDSEQNPSRPQWRHTNAHNVGEESFNVEFKSGLTPDSVPKEGVVLAAVVDAYNQNSEAAQFELRNPKPQNEDEHFAVIGMAGRGQNRSASGGQHEDASNQAPILDLLITLAKEPRSAPESIALICRKISEQSGIPVTPTIAGNLLERKTAAVGGNEVPARTLLSLALASMRSLLRWCLLYDATAKSYELRITS